MSCPQRLLSIFGVLGLAFQCQQAIAETTWMLVKVRDGYGSSLEKIQVESVMECQSMGELLRSNPRWDNGGERRFDFACLKGK